MADYSLNLLDLPDLVLEEIFSYCLRYLEEVKECCTFLKDFIESHKRLKKPPSKELYLPVVFNKENDAYLQADLQKYYNTNEIYDSIWIIAEDDRDVEVINSESNLTVEKVLKKDAEFVEKFRVTIETVNVKTVKNSMILAKYFKNLVSCTIELQEGDNEWGYDFTEKRIYNKLRWAIERCSFPKLKKLEFCADLILPITMFRHCNTIESLTVSFYSFTKKTLKICKILSNSKSTLRELYLHLFDDGSGMFYNLMAEIGLDLKKIVITFNYDENEIIPIIKDIDFNAIINFLKTQRNLTELYIQAKCNEYFLSSLKSTLPELINLKTLKLEFDQLPADYIFPEHKESLRWNLSSVEKISIQFNPTNYDRYNHAMILSYIFGSPSEKLKKIDLDCYEYVFADGEFETIMRNCPFLTDLKLTECNSNNKFSSNEIFHILKYLKKLQILEFQFPRESALEITRFDESQNLSLPEIVKVSLKFNDTITNDHLRKLLPLLRNVSKFSFEPCRNMNDESYDIITRELTNLCYLGFGYYWKTDGKPTLNALNMMKSNIAKFNSNPNKFYFKNIETSIRKIKEKKEVPME